MKNKAFYYLVALVFLTVFSLKVKEVNRNEEIIIPVPFEDDLRRGTIGRKLERQQPCSKFARLNSYNSSNGKVKSAGRTL